MAVYDFFALQSHFDACTFYSSYGITINTTADVDASSMARIEELSAVSREYAMTPLSAA